MVTGRISTYDLTVGVMLDIEDMIYLLDPFDTPLLGTYGVDGRSTIAKGTCYEKKVEWLDDTLLAPRDALNGAIVTADAFITVDSRLKFTTNDVILIADEYMLITGYGTTAETLLVTRGFGDSSAASQADNAVVVGTGTALVEGSDPNDARSVDRSNVHNFTQIFGPHKVEISMTENVVRKYGLRGTSEFDYQVSQRLKEIAISIEQTLLYGQREEDTTNKRRTMGGLAFYITTNKDTTTTDLTESKLLDKLQSCYDVGGSPDRLVLGSTQKRKVSQYSTSLVQLDRTDETRGQVVDYYESDFGRISILLNRWVRVSDGFLFARDQVQCATLRPLVFEVLGKTGDSHKGQIVGEKTLRYHKQKHSARWTALT